MDVGYADMTSEASISQGTANQNFYAQFPPVVAHTQTVYVDGEAWTEIADFSSTGPKDKVYTIEDKSGKITFGDGTHGMIPVSGSKVTITYNTKHDGYVQYYNTLKSINPNITVGAEHGSEKFMQAMGTAYPYDSLDYHPLGTGYPSTSLSDPEFTKQLFAVPRKQIEYLSDLQSMIKENSGKDIPLELKAYGHVQSNIAKGGSKASHLFLVEGLVEASLLMAYQNLGIEVAHRFLLNDTPFHPDADSAPTARRYNAAIISNGTDDKFVATPVGLAIGIMSKLGGKTQVSSVVTNNPEVELATDPASTYDSLNTIAAIDDNGNVDLIVINQNLGSDLTAKVVLDNYSHANIAEVSTLNGESPYSMNTLEETDNVKVTTQDVEVGTGDFEYTFPAHSITRIVLKTSSPTGGDDSDDDESNNSGNHSEGNTSNTTFKDVSANEWYNKAVTFVAARGITNGTGDGNYSPDAKLSRAQFLVMVLRAYGINSADNAEDNFKDAGDTYYTGYLAAAKRLGITNGIGNNMFAPDTEVTRQEMCTLLYNTLKSIDKLPKAKTEKTLASYTDANDVASWAKDAFTLFITTGIISGSNGKLSPNETADRAQMAQIMYNLLSE